MSKHEGKPAAWQYRYLFNVNRPNEHWGEWHVAPDSVLKNVRHHIATGCKLYQIRPLYPGAIEKQT